MAIPCGNTHDQARHKLFDPSQDICGFMRSYLIISRFLLKTPQLQVSGSPKGLLPLSLEAVLLGDIGIFVQKSDLTDLDSPSDFNNLRQELTEVLTAHRKILVLPNRGIFIIGTTVEEAWFLVQRVQAACEVQVCLARESKGFG